MGTRAIARDTGIPRKLVSDLIHDAGLANGPGRPPVHHIDGAWLREQYLTHKRTMPDLAREVGVSVSTLRRHARQMSIPTRPRGGAGHVGALASVARPNASTKP